MEENKKKYLDSRLIYTLSFFLPLGIMTGCMICYGVAPFGDRSFIIIDGLHQYMSFFSVFYDKLKTGESLLYTFRTGMGVNFLALYAYYLSSPFNIFILLFRRAQLNTIVSLLLVIKIALAGLAAGVFFKRKAAHPGLSVVAAACLYALNSYMVGYCWNVNWLDALMIFPVIIMGIDRIIRTGDGRLYCIALFYALYCNYYIGFMICIFCVLWYLTSSFKSIRHFFLRGCIFAFYSFLAAGIAAVLLLPAWQGIRQTASGEEMLLPSHGWLTGFADLLNRQFAMTTPISHDNFDGNINLYFGMAALFAALLYLLNTKIRLVEKIRKVFLLALLYISFNEKILNYIWHGFHDQYGIPNRFSFLFGFILITMMVEVLDHFNDIRNWQVVAASAICIGLISVSRQFASQPLEEAVYIAAGATALFYGTILLLMTVSRKYKLIYGWVFCAAAVVEICVTAILGFGEIGQISISKFFSYTEEMEKEIRSLEDGTFYRSELAGSAFVDESTWYPMRPVSLFGSTARHDMVEFMDDIGFYTGCNEYLYKGSNPVSDMMLDVRYLYHKPGDWVNSAFPYRETYESISVYENPVEGLSIGYAIDEDIDVWDYDNAYPFRVLNDFASCGYSCDGIFRDIPIEDPVTKGCRAERTNDGEYHFYYDEQMDDNLVFTIKMKEAADHLYLFYDGTQVEDVRIMAGEESVIQGDRDATMLYAGSADAGEEIKVSMKLKGETQDGYIRLSAASLDQDEFDRLSAAMTRGAFHVTDWSDDSLRGTARIRKGQMLYFSIPYDEGWKITADGRKVKAERVGNALLGLRLSEGKHTISMHYIPPGYPEGKAVSLVCILIFAAICLYCHRKKVLHRRKMEALADDFQCE